MYMRPIRITFRVSMAICLLLSLMMPVRADAARTVGVVMSANIPYFEKIHEAFLRELKDIGLADGTGLSVIVQRPAPDPVAWANAVRKLIVYDASIIVTYGTPATRVAVDASEDIPVVFAAVPDPDDITEAGKKATGVSSHVPVATVLRNLKAISRFARLGIIYSESEKETVSQAREAASLKDSLGFTPVMFNLTRKGDEKKIKGVDALFLTSSCTAMYCIQNITSIARSLRIPTAATVGGGESAGTVITITADPAEQGREAARLVAQILKGKKAGSLAYRRPRRINFILNLKEARWLGLSVPLKVLTAATRIIK